ncbi:MAG: bifunctional (p)ppGpp synthetase/guanosine-3',5'-bis(diphosphate) 3'-pyrophosphohydrolase [Anaerolineae bacterium]|nr:bifunctional (p)ppGpp synthetase/guanosine-3',5'-bis(diphosphate) 3'-pyrophosphohydrolase [Anaerolineae bacterium]
MQEQVADFHRPPTTQDPDTLYAILEAQAASYFREPSDLELLIKAYRYASEAHQDVVRDSGELYVTHPLHVALILTYLQLDVETLAAALLHDVVEDTPITQQDLERDFGAGIATLVDGVTKLNLLSKWSKREHDAANVLKVIMSMSGDVRVIFVKLADRLHNLRTLQFKADSASRERTAREALEVYAPVADRLGIAMLRKEIEDIAFFYLDPAAYKRIKTSIETRYQDHEKIEQIERETMELLHSWGVQTESVGIRPNPRRVYDMYRRLNEEAHFHQDTLRRVPPQLRFHVIVADSLSCYIAMAAIHARWAPITSEIRDYISAPLPNGYQSLHTTVFINRQPVKFQIRTPQMDRTSQLGVIAHMQEDGWRNTHSTLKETIDALNSFGEEGLSSVDDPMQVLNSLKTEELQAEIYVYTPQNEMIKLPVGSTPIDFAYRVHTEVGHQCRGALVDGHWTPLNRPLRTGEHVQILTSQEAKPNFDWLNPDLGYTQSPTAKEKIRRWFRRHPQGVQIALGRQQLRRITDRLSMSVDDWTALARRWGCKTERELFLLVGSCQVPIEGLLPDLLDIYGKSQLPPISSGQIEETIIGTGSLAKEIATCCQPHPGDDIVGYISPAQHAVLVHRSDCPTFLLQFERDRSKLIKIHWGKSSATRLACIEIHAHDRPFFLRDVLDILYDEEINIADVDVQVHRSQDAIISIGIDISNWIQFHRVLVRIEDLPGAIRIRRVEVESSRSRQHLQPVDDDKAEAASSPPKDSLVANALSRFFPQRRPGHSPQPPYRQ